MHRHHENPHLAVNLSDPMTCQKLNGLGPQYVQTCHWHLGSPDNAVSDCQCVRFHSRRHQSLASMNEVRWFIAGYTGSGSEASLVTSPSTGSTCTEDAMLRCPQIQQGEEDDGEQDARSVNMPTPLQPRLHVSYSDDLNPSSLVHLANINAYRHVHRSGALTTGAIDTDPEILLIGSLSHLPTYLAQLRRQSGRDSDRASASDAGARLPPPCPQSRMIRWRLQF